MGLAASSQPQPFDPPAVYRPRNARHSPLYQMLETYYDDVKAVWEERFETKYGFWRGFVDQVVARYLDCGVAEAGFARLRCDACGAEKLLTLSCKQRGICPSCDAKRAAAFAAFIKDELLENVGHGLWTFTLPKMLRPYFMRNRELLADLASLAYQTIEQLMADAVGDRNARPGVVAVPQTFGSVLNVHPHAHCLASRGVWDEKGQWLPVPYVDTGAAEKLFAHKIFRLLKRKGLVSDERLELLLSFRNSGFSVDTSPTVWPQDTQGLERLCRYILRCPVSLSRIHWTPGAKTLFYESKQHANHDDGGEPLFSHPKGDTLDVFEFIARVLTQIPQPRAHGMRYFGAYSSRARALRAKRKLTLQSLDNDNGNGSTDGTSPNQPQLSPHKRAALRKSWARLIKRVYLSDPLNCECGGTLRVVAFIIEQKVIRKILDHLADSKTRSRAPPP
jgi:Putative transposase/Transposase zinc-binding domain